MTQYLGAAAVLIAAAAVIASDFGLLHPQWTMLPTLVAYVLLGGAMFVALLLQTFRVRAVPLIACAVALGVEIGLRDWGIAAQLVACGALLFVLAGYAGVLLGGVVRHAY